MAFSEDYFCLAGLFHLSPSLSPGLLPGSAQEWPTAGLSCRTPTPATRGPGWAPEPMEGHSAAWPPAAPPAGDLWGHNRPSVPLSSPSQAGRCFQVLPWDVALQTQSAKRKHLGKTTASPWVLGTSAPPPGAALTPRMVPSRRQGARLGLYVSSGRVGGLRPRHTGTAQLSSP